VTSLHHMQIVRDVGPYNFNCRNQTEGLLVTEPVTFTYGEMWWYIGNDARRWQVTADH